MRLSGREGNGVQYGWKITLLIKAAQHAMTGRRVSQMDQLPVADLDLVPALLVDNARTGLVRSKSLAASGRMKHGGEKLSVPLVACGDPRVGTDPQREHFLQLESARKLVRRTEVESGRESARLQRRRRLALVVGDELCERLAGIESNPIQEDREINLGRGCGRLARQQSQKRQPSCQNDRRRGCETEARGKAEQARDALPAAVVEFIQPTLNGWPEFGRNLRRRRACQPIREKLERFKLGPARRAFLKTR